MAERRRIIFVDDELHLLVGVARHLAESRDDWEITYFQNARDALSHYEAHGADIVVTDIMMPEMDGLELIAAIRRASGRTRILALSSDGRRRLAGLISAATVVGADRVLHKPFDSEALIAAIAALI